MEAHDDTQSSGSDRTRVLNRLEQVQSERGVRVTELERIAKRREELTAELRSLAEESYNLRSWLSANPGKRFEYTKWERWFKAERDLVERLNRLPE